MCAVGGRQTQVPPYALMRIALLVSKLDWGAMIRVWVRMRIFFGDVPRVRSTTLNVTTRISEEIW